MNSPRRGISIFFISLPHTISQIFLGAGFFFIFWLFLSGCSFAPGAPIVVQGSKDIAQMEKEILPFRQISLAIPARIEISPEDEVLCKISADDNLLPYIEVGQYGDSLEILAKNGYSLAPSQPVRIRLGALSINKIDLTTDGQIAATGLDGEELKISLKGDGKINLYDVHYQKIKTTLDGRGVVTLSGDADTQIVYLSGGGKYAAESFVSDNGTASIGGVGDINLYVKRDLVVFIGGSGNVRYWGEPKVSQKITGPGKLFAMGSSVMGTGIPEILLP